MTPRPALRETIRVLAISYGRCTLPRRECQWSASVPREVEIGQCRSSGGGVAVDNWPLIVAIWVRCAWRTHAQPTRTAQLLVAVDVHVQARTRLVGRRIDRFAGLGRIIARGWPQLRLLRLMPTIRQDRKLSSPADATPFSPSVRLSWAEIGSVRRAHMSPLKGRRACNILCSGIRRRPRGLQCSRPSTGG